MGIGLFVPCFIDAGDRSSTKVVAIEPIVHSWRSKWELSL